MTERSDALFWAVHRFFIAELLQDPERVRQARAALIAAHDALAPFMGDDPEKPQTVPGAYGIPVEVGP